MSSFHIQSRDAKIVKGQCEACHEQNNQYWPKLNACKLQMKTQWKICIAATRWHYMHIFGGFKYMKGIYDISFGESIPKNASLILVVINLKLHIKVDQFKGEATT